MIRVLFDVALNPISKKLYRHLRAEGLGFDFHMTTDGSIMIDQDAVETLSWSTVVDIATNTILFQVTAVLHDGQTQVLTFNTDGKLETVNIVDPTEPPGTPDEAPDPDTVFESFSRASNRQKRLIRTHCLFSALFGQGQPTVGRS